MSGIMPGTTSARPFSTYPPDAAITQAARNDLSKAERM